MHKHLGFNYINEPHPCSPPSTSASVNCNSILTHDFAKVSTVTKAQSPLLTTECSLLSAGGARACPCACQQLQGRRGTGSEAAALTCWGVSVPHPVTLAKKNNPSSQYIHTWSKSLPNPRSPNPLATRGTTTITENNTLKLQGILAQLPHHIIKAHLAQYISSSCPRKRPKSLYEMVTAAQARILARITMCFTQYLFSLPKHSTRKHTQPAAWGHKTLKTTFQRWTAPRAAYLARQALCRVITC